MENKETKIIPPKGYEIDKENSTFECIKFKKKSLTYEDVENNLFCGNGYYYITSDGRINYDNCYRYFDPNTATSEKQLEKLLAINKLMNVAKYLNGDWKPNYDCGYEPKYFICLNKHNELIIDYLCTVVQCDIYFKTKELAQQAIDILGEDTICLALSTDW